MGAVALGVGLCVVLQPAMGFQVPHLVLLAAALIVALFAGMGPGALAVALGAIATFALLPRDSNHWIHRSPSDVLGLVLYLAVGWVAVAICEAQRRSKMLAERNLELAMERSAELEREMDRRMHAQAEAREAADGNKRILESVGDGVMALDLDWNFLYANQNAVQMLGLPEADVVGRSVWQAAPSLSGSSFEKEIKEAMAAGMPRRFESYNAATGTHWENRTYPTPTGITIFCRDITEQRRIEEELHGSRLRLEQSEERYRAFIAQSSEAIWRFELAEPVPISLPSEEQVELLYRHAYLAECNDQMARMHGFERAEQIVGAPLDQVRPRSQPGNEEYLLGLAKNGYRADGAEYQEQDADGTPRFFLRNVVGIVEDGMLVRTWGTQRDITERKLAEADLHRALQKLDTHVSNSPLAILEWDQDLRVTRWSTNAERMFGWTADEVLGKTLAELNLVHESEAPRIHRLLAGVKSAGRSGAAVTARLRCRNGDMLCCEWYCSALLDERGQLASVMCLLHDITAQKLAVEAVHDSEARLRIALEAAQMASWEWAEGTDALTVSDQIYDLCDLPRDEAVTLGRLLEAVHPMDRDRVRRAVVGAVASSDDYRLEFRIVRRDGSVRWIAVKGRAFHGAQEQDRHLAGVLQDVTDKLRQEQEIRQLNAELEQRVAQRTRELQHANEELESFCYSVSHDLRGPLRSIIGASMIMQEDYGAKLEQDATDNLRRIVASAKKMAQLIDDLLQLSRLSRMEVARGPVDITEIARDVEAELKSRGATADVVIEPDLTSVGDSRLLRVALINLMENAVKFSAKSPEPRVEVGSLANQDGRVMFVRDNGIGFDAQYGQKIFEPFQRLHRETDYPGTGIGLANVKRIIERHGGRIWVESAEGEGATFYFTL